MNHPFIDWNKRTSFICAVAFLNRNGLDLDIDYDDGFDLSMRLATHSIEREALASLIEPLIVQQKD